ncbi:GNAT family N-acetyltransferase [Erysipelothrix aquatica]|uniref:GNAT family N-acetyltransferase n=1 Tax=Erysipelothrix aquatica TaxID=2683714 RepID=UPI001F3A0DBB|nr:GNAT family N-acetyltransferase [Erysipelothrix aquatica]
MKSIDSVYISMYYGGVRKVKRFIMKYRIVDNSLTPQIYQALHTDANFMDYDAKDIEIALAHDLYDVVVYDEYDEAIGCARVIGDNRIVFFLKDVIVRKDYQRNGVGKILVDYALEYISTVACDNAYIGLMSTRGMESFYKRFGFIERPNDGLGSGMVMYYEQK